MDPVEQLLAWAEPQGIILNGLAPKALPGRGIGLVVTKDIEPNETILTVPTSSLRTLSNTPSYIRDPLKSSTVHAILTASLCLETSASFTPWSAVLPPRDTLTTAVPLSWALSLQTLLPPLEKALLRKQQAKFAKDWSDVHAAFPSIPRDDFEYNWLLVNTRTFYHTNKSTERLPKEDHMALQPVADLFNHSPQGCTVSFTPSGFAITTVAPHRAGDEMFIRYGTHSNAFLMVEYGFTLPVKANPWDETSLDPWIEPLFSTTTASASVAVAAAAAGGMGQDNRRRRREQRAILEDEGWWGGWMLDSDTACYRTYTALRLLVLGGDEGRWRDVLEGRRDEDHDRGAVESLLRKVLETAEEDVSEMLRELEEENGDGREKAIRGMLRERWAQVGELVAKGLARLEHVE